MDDRKYKQRGYQDTRENGNFRRDERPKPSGPRPPLDVTGPRLPRLLQNVVAARCYSCSSMLAHDIEWRGGACPKCAVALHCCKQCAHFEPSTRFQCLKPVPARIVSKDQSNECDLFKPRVTVARDAAPQGSAPQTSASAAPAVPRNANDARIAFDNLFKK